MQKTYPQPPSKYTTILDASREKDAHIVKEDGVFSNDSKKHILKSTVVTSEEELNKTSVKKMLTLQTISKPLITMEYAVRGAILDCAEKLQQELNENPGKYQFTELVPANIGNPIAVGQLPITFHRQFLSCLLNPALIQATGQLNSTTLHNNESHFLYPFDVRQRADIYLKACPKFGAYSNSKGFPYVLQLVANWFEARDSVSCLPESVILSNGASGAIECILQLLISSPQDGILLPIPQYPLYSATITKLNGSIVPYYLNEKLGWGLTIDELERAYKTARDKRIFVKALVVINPGNPTGSMLNEKELCDIIRFCEKYHLVLLADEVYQNNVYISQRFVSMRQCLFKLKSNIELISFHSASKSIGECGIRGGFMQIENFEQETINILAKLVSVMLCPNILGQALVGSMVTPLTLQDPSYALWIEETQNIQQSLKRKAKLANKYLNSHPTISCQPILGAMYAFPQINLPEKAILHAQELNLAPDMFYCMELLKATGVICVPGSGFQQYPGTHHFRITLLPEEKKFEALLQNMLKFHQEFIENYS